MLENINKIVVIGGPETGKTTLSKKISSILSISYFSIDNIKFYKNWIPKKRKDIDDEIYKITNTDKWIIEGNHLRNLEIILSKANIVIFLDFPLHLQLFGIFKRFFSSYKKCVKDMKNCEEKISFTFFIKTLLFNISKRPKIISTIMKRHDLRLYLIANYSQIDDFIIKLQNGRK